jgi:CubicO group peptidase (beta-lactamase class C family)
MNRSAVVRTREPGFFAPSIFVLLLASPLQARADAVDAYVRAEMRDLHVPGLSLAVVREGKLVEARYFGLASLELKRAVTQDTVFEIGSMTKQFTAAAS